MEENLQRGSRVGNCLLDVKTCVAEKRGLVRLGNKSKDLIGKQNMKYQTIRCFLLTHTEDVEHAKRGNV